MLEEPEIAPETTPDADEDTYILSPELVEDVAAAVQAQDIIALEALLAPLHPADIADLLEQIDEKRRAPLMRMLPTDLYATVLSELDDSLRDEVIRDLHPGQLADVFRELETDDVVDVVEDLDPPQQEAVLDALEPVERVAVEKALTYPEESAGRLMQSEVVFAPQDWTVGDAIDHLRDAGDTLPEQFYHVILVDTRMKPQGNVTLGRILSAKRDTKLMDVREETFQTIPADQDEGDVAYAFNQYHLISAPVVDADDRLVGVITIDDAMAVLDEEAEEDILRLAGVGDSSISDNVWETIQGRMPWLAVNLVTAIIASLVIAMFDETIAGFVALAVLMPIVASMGGNAGTQSLTVAVRAIATKDLTDTNVWRLIRREVMVGLINGAIFAVIMGTIGAIWFGTPLLGIVIAAAMIINLVVAGLAGTMIPVILERLGIDPALASGAFVTTVTDVIGFFAFLGLAAAILI